MELNRFGRAVAVLVMVSAGLLMGLADYTVQSGDTLSEIARDSGVDQSKLVELNGLASADQIQVGQVLALSPAVFTGSVEAANDDSLMAATSTSVAAIHVVTQGEYLSTIARQYGVKTLALVQANQIPAPDQILVGQQLLIPVGFDFAGSDSKRPITGHSGEAVPAVYRVQPGDYLGLIARRAGVSVAHLARINRITNPNHLLVGQTLRVASGPAAPIQPIAEIREVRVEPGDSLSEIAAENRSTVAAIVETNEIVDPSAIVPGQLLEVPAKPVNDSPQSVSCQASWYGDYFAGRPTASGEIFDTSLMTAASHFVALHTWVDVSRPDTDDSIRVKINDRGPYHMVDGEWQPHPVRCIDLSESAAEALGGKELGHFEVVVTFPSGTVGLNELADLYGHR